jgi:hypothetical protein
MGVNESSHSSDNRNPTAKEAKPEIEVLMEKEADEKDSRSVFPPQAKWIIYDKEDQPSDDEKNKRKFDVRIDIEEIESPKAAKSPKSPKEGNLAQKHIVEFYPYVEEGDGEDKRKHINERSIKRVQAATENTRYKDKNSPQTTKSQEPLYFGSLLQKNALMTVVNESYKKDPEIKVNPLMKSIPKNIEEQKQEEHEQNEERPYGLGFGKNPKLNSTRKKRRKKRNKRESPLQLNTNSFYDSNTSKKNIEENKEDDEASWI